MPDQLTRSFFISFVSFLRLRSNRSSCSRAEPLRHSLARSPPQKRDCQSVCSSAVFPATSSTPWLHRLGLGKGTLAVSSTARHDGVSPELELYAANCHRGFSSPYSCLGSTVATPGSSCRARLSQSWLAVTGVSRWSTAVPPSPAMSPLR